MDVDESLHCMSVLKLPNNFNSDSRISDPVPSPQECRFRVQNLMGQQIILCH